MLIKIYSDETYNIFFEKNDYVKIKHNPKFPEPKSKEGTFGKVVKVIGKKMNSVEFVDSDNNKHLEYIWNLQAVDEKGKLIPESKLFELKPIKESLTEVLGFDEFSMRMNRN
jgi:hypothetical protein